MPKTSEVSKNQFTVAQFALSPKGMIFLKDKGSGRALSIPIKSVGLTFTLNTLGTS